MPIPEALANESKTARGRLAVVGEEWVFKQACKVAPWAPAQCQHFLRRAEQAANVEKLDGGLWHAYRRKWATERKDLSLKDVAVAGGWKDVATLLTSYQHADEATMLKVMESLLKLLGRRAAGGLGETVAAGAETKRPDAIQVASDLRVALPGLEPGLS